MKSKFVFLTLFLLFAAVILSRPSTYSDGLIADEVKFYEHAENITHGYYADPARPNLMEGPGYPIFLAPWVAINAPFYLIRTFNILFLSFACLYLFLILKRYIHLRAAIVLTFLFALYPPMLRWANLLYAESPMLLTLLGFCYHFIIWYRKEANYKKHFFPAMFCLGYLALTKIIFAYVTVAALLGVLVLLAFPKVFKALQLRRGVLLLAGGILVFSLYVTYTYQLTGKFFYLGMHGGETLYARSTPFDNEFGNWFSEWHVLQGGTPTGREDIMIGMDQLRENHGEFLASIESLSPIEKDSLLTQKALENMESHPQKYLKNTVANVSRIFFHFPFSYRIQNLDTLGYLVPNIFIVVLAVFGIYPAFIRRKSIPKELIILMALSIIYLGGHTLLDGRGRYLIPVVPIWTMFFSFVYFRIVQIKINDSKSIKG